MTRSAPKTAWRDYFSILDFNQRFSSEEACELEVIKKIILLDDK